MEASKEKQSQYQESIQEIAYRSLVSGIDMAICKERIWGRKSEKLVGKKSGKYYARTNIIAGLVNNKP